MSVEIQLPLQRAGVLRQLWISLLSLRALLVPLDELQQLLDFVRVIMSGCSLSLNPELLHLLLHALQKHGEHGRLVDVGPHEALPVGLLPGRRKELLPGIQFGVIVSADALQGLALAEVSEVVINLLLYSGAEVSGRLAASLAQSAVESGDEAVVLGHDGTVML